MLDARLVSSSLLSSHWEGVIRELSSLLVRTGYVKGSFADASVEREREFPTGLPTPTIGVAIPHADVLHVNKPAMAIGVCRTPVRFGVMGGATGETMDVSLVFLLAIAEAHAHIDTLTQLMAFFQDADATAAVVRAKTPEDMLTVVRKYVTHDV